MKVLAIAWKDLSITFRDRNALLLMILAPLVLSFIIGASFGNFLLGGSSVPFDQIPVLVVNEDDGEMGEQFVATMQAGELAELLLVTEMTDLDEARAIVQRGEARAAVYIPAEFSTAVRGSTGSSSPAIIAFYADPTATVTPNIVRGIVMQIANSFNTGAIGAQVTVEQLMGQTAVLGPALAQLGTVLEEQIGTQLGEANSSVTINLRQISVGEIEEPVEISPFAFFAPSMGILFLMFAMMDSTRSILEEERAGTLPRLLTTPIAHSELLMGKVGGVFLAGIIQFVVFVVASRLLFQLNWGQSVSGLALMVLAIVLAYTGLGLLIAAFARDVNQAAIFGSVISLVFAALGGNFVNAQNFPPWLDQLSKITINRWGIDGLTALTIYNGGLADVLMPAAILLGIGGLFFLLALWQFDRRMTK
ncbi:MAG: ABC-2 transporter permease [Anaerolineae bacterium]|nr:ABC-2 transporter permease [Anaerolineae bacterium]